MLLRTPPIPFSGSSAGWLLFTAAMCSGGASAQTVATQTVRLGDYSFTIPAGMQLEPATTDGLTTWPIVVDWDARGRLLVVESGGVSKPIVEHNRQLLHRVVRLEDSDGDGRFDQRTVVAKDLPFMEGILCLGNDLLVSAPPHIYRLIDADGDGLCEARQIWHDGQTITGCANDLHGPYFGRDGWIYWCKGAFAKQEHTLVGGGQLTTSAAHIFRRPLDGSGVEPVMTGGMDNPVEVAITPEGERFFTSTFLHTPGHGLRDGVAHAVYGGLYGKPNPATAGHVRTGDLMPVLIDLGAAAPSGLICLNSNELLPSPEDNSRTLVAALFNLQKVTAHQLTPQGATFESSNRDLVVGDRVDFHPTDVLEDADGSLLIIDTGGWYNLCCPSSRVDQQTAAGGIYRLSPAARQASSQSPGTIAASPTASLRFSQQLNDPRPWVVRQAQLALLQLSTDAAEKDAAAAAAAELAAAMDDPQATLDQQINCQWGLCCLGTPAAMQAITARLGGDDQAATRDPRLLHAACHAVSVHRYQPAKGALEQLLSHHELHVRRAAAEALGRIGDATSASRLLAGLQHNPTADRHWEHSVTYALIELGAGQWLLEQLAAADAPQRLSPQQKMVALRAADQLGAAQRLPATLLLDGLGSSHTDYRRAASEILARHPQWAGDYRAAMLDLLDRTKRGSSEAAAALQTLVSGWRETPAVQELIGGWLAGAGDLSADQQRLLAELLASYANTPLPAAWDDALAGWLVDLAPERQLELARTLAEVDLSQTVACRRALLAEASRTSDLQASLQLLAAVPAGTRLDERLPSQTSADLADAAALEARLLESLAVATTPAAAEGLPELAMAALQRIRLSPASGRRLLEGLSDQPPRVLPLVVEALSRIGDDQLDSQMLTQLGELPAARTLSEDQLVNLYRRRSSTLQSAVQRTVAQLTRPSSDIEQQLDQMLVRLTAGDPIRGLQLFRSNKTGCSSCHRLGYVGGEIGPILTNIGSTRTRRALLEAIMFPNARLEQSYQSTKILTHDGQVYNGLITKHLSPTQFEMQLTADKSIVLSTADVAEQHASQVSIMPSGLAELLTPEELSDLLSILESAK